MPFALPGARGAALTLAALVVALSSPAPARVAAQEAATGVVAGRVTARADTGAATPVEGVSVSVAGSSLGSVTDAAGRFVIARVPPGSVTLRFRLLTYRATERTVRVRAGDTTRVEVTLEPEAQILAEVRTRAEPADTGTWMSKPNVGTVTMGAAAIAGVPSIGEPDVVRVVQLLPGVVARNDFNTGLNVRGGEADQNLILLDGYPVYNPFHLAGLFSTFMDATVGEIELVTGAFPARYGGRLSSVLDVRSAEDTRPGVHATADVSALGATARLAGALGSGGAWSVAGRRTYADAVTKLFTDDIFPYHFRDFHARAAYALPGGVRLSMTGYLGKDVLDANLADFASDSGESRAGEGQWAFEWGNQVLGATIAKDFVGGRLADSVTLEQRVSTSGFSTTLDLGDGALTRRNEIRDLRLAGSLTARGTAHDLSVGYDVAAYRVRYASLAPQTGTTSFDFVQRPRSGALWIDDLWRVSSRWLVEGGLRAEALSGRHWAALSPRVSVKFFATPDLALTAAAGRATQWQHSLAGDGPLRFFDVWIASDRYIPVAAAWHAIAGAERRLGDAGSVRLEGYYKRYPRVMEANWSEDPQRRGDEVLPAEGRSYGLDVLARWQPAGGRVGGWVTYSYGVSSRWRDGERWAPGHDRRHDLDVVATWRAAKYRLGARFGFATGSPYTPIVGQIARRVYDPSRDTWGTGEPEILLESLGGPHNGARFPATHRLDLDASREFRVGAAAVTPYVSVVNAYNAKNILVYLYDYNTDRPNRRALSQFPVLPSLGVRVAF